MILDSTAGATFFGVLSTIKLSRTYLDYNVTDVPGVYRIEQDILSQSDDEKLAELVSYKANLKKLRRIFIYHEQLFAELKSNSFPGVQPERGHEITDAYEQQERTNSLAMLYYELASDLMETYLSVAAHRLNNIMKILTIVTAIFVPLSFLA